MLLESVAYARPDTVVEALETLASSDSAAPLAGGQSLVNVLKHRVAQVDLLVDISRLAELRTIEATAEGGLEIGACVTYDEIDGSEAARASHPLLAEVAGHIEDQQIRCRGTIGGNCCLSDPTNNLPPLLVALDATMVIASRQGPRDVPAREFFHGYFSTAVGEGELLRSVSIPPLAGAGAGFSTVGVGADSKAIARAAAVVRGNGTIEDARVVLACVAPAPLRHGGMEDALRGSPSSPEAVREAARRIGADLEPHGDVHGSADYRREMARVVARRAVLQAIRREVRTVVDAGRAHSIEVTINGEKQEATVPARQLLVHLLRDTLGMKGTHVGCDTGSCGACTVIVDGRLTKSCMMLAPQADGAEIETIEGVAQNGELTPVQRAFHEQHGLQCGYCTPGLVMAATFLLRRNPSPTQEEIRRAIRGNICRCTGYVNIVRAIEAAASNGGSGEAA